jgi:hypothetical protein
VNPKSRVEPALIPYVTNLRRYDNHSGNRCKNFFFFFFCVEGVCAREEVTTHITVQRKHLATSKPD